MTPLHKISRAYWDAFYTGMMAVGLDPKERPAFRAGGDSESEVMRCMRHAINTLRYPPLEAWEAAKARGMEIDAEQWAVLFDAMFPEPIKPRKAALTGNDMAVKGRSKRKFG